MVRPQIGGRGEAELNVLFEFQGLKVEVRLGKWKKAEGKSG